MKKMQTENVDSDMWRIVKKELNLNGKNISVEVEGKN